MKEFGSEGSEGSSIEQRVTVVGSYIYIIIASLKVTEAYQSWWLVYVVAGLVYLNERENVGNLGQLVHAELQLHCHISTPAASESTKEAEGSEGGNNNVKVYDQSVVKKCKNVKSV